MPQASCDCEAWGVFVFVDRRCRSGGQDLAEPAGREAQSVGEFRTGQVRLGLHDRLREVAGDGGMVLKAARADALAGLSSVVAEFYDGSRNGTLDRLKMCASEECRRVFFDRSKPSTRRWCMSSLCGNRMKTRSYRERQRGAG